VYYAFQGDEDQQDLRPKAQTIADFKDFITKFYPANQQQTFIYRQESAFHNTPCYPFIGLPHQHICLQQQAGPLQLSVITATTRPATFCILCCVPAHSASAGTALPAQASNVHPTCPLMFCCCRDKLMKNHLSLEVDLVHVREFNQELGDGLENKPAEYLPLVSSSSRCGDGSCQGSICKQGRRL
jgi:hypothetical protein